MRTWHYEGIAVDLPDEWELFTEFDPPSAPPFTVSRQNEGVFQISTGIYQGGTVPNPTAEQLLTMLLKHGVHNDLGPPQDQGVQPGCPRWATASYHTEGHLVRLWLVSDGWSFALVSYIGAGATVELQEAEAAVRSLRFEDPAHVEAA